MDIKIEHIELENRMRDEEGPVVPRLTLPRVEHDAAPEPEKVLRPENYFSADTLRRLIFRAFYQVLAADGKLTDAWRNTVMKNLWLRMSREDLVGMADCLEDTVRKLWRHKRITRATYDILASFQKIRERIRTQVPVEADDEPDEFTELSHLMGVTGVDKKT